MDDDVNDLVEELPSYLVPRLGANNDDDEDESVLVDDDERDSPALLNEEEEVLAADAADHTPVDEFMEIDDDEPLAKFFWADGNMAEESSLSDDDVGENEIDEGDDDVGEGDGVMSSTTNNNNNSAPNLLHAFPISRVKELLRFERGNASSVISKDTAHAATEAVAMMIQDLVRTSAASAARSGRMTVSYDDVARTIHMCDRFYYLTSIIPTAAPPPTQRRAKKMSSTTAASAQPGGGDGVGAEQQPPTTRTRRSSSKTKPTNAHVGGTSSIHPVPGAMRQSTLRF